jgi:hypothetical protein
MEACVEHYFMEAGLAANRKQLRHQSSEEIYAGMQQLALLPPSLLQLLSIAGRAIDMLLVAVIAPRKKELPITLKDSALTKKALLHSASTMSGVSVFLVKNDAADAEPAEAFFSLVIFATAFSVRLLFFAECSYRELSLLIAALAFFNSRCPDFCFGLHAPTS